MKDNKMANTMKKLHFFFLALTLPLWAEAKTGMVFSEEGDDGIIASQQAEGDIWGYYASETPVNSYYSIGDPASTRHAIIFRADETLRGAQITAIRVPVMNERYAEIMEQGTVWIAEDLKSGEKVREVPIPHLTVGEYTDIPLPEPYTITEERTYVGFTCPGQVSINAYDYNTLGYYYWESRGAWKYIYNYLPCLQFRLKNHHIPEAAAQFAAPDIKPATYAGHTSPVTFHLQNMGLEKISSIDYTIIIDGKEDSQHLDVSILNGMSQARDVAIPVTGASQSGNYDVILRIDKVNGKENALKEQPCKTVFYGLSRQVERRTLMEMTASIREPGCISGLVGMELAKKKYGDRLISVVEHLSGPMDIDEYNEYTIPGLYAPCCQIDRRNGTYDPLDGLYDPYQDTFAPTATTNVLDEAIQVVPSVDVSVKGEWNADKTEINVSCEVEFLVDEPRNHYSIDYFIVADSVRGTGKGWYMSNEYYGTSNDDPNLKPYTELNRTITDVVYNDVLIRQAYNSFMGYGEIIAGEKKTNSETLALSLSDELAAAVDKDEVYVIAVVYKNSILGPVANAAKAKVTECSHPEGIATIGASLQPTGVYTLGGQLVRRDAKSLKSLPRGLYIVNGRKVAVGNSNEH